LGTIKSYPGIKAAIYWDNINLEFDDDHTLTAESMEILMEILREALKEPYFIMNDYFNNRVKLFELHLEFGYFCTRPHK
jgi:hypothetical protein